MSHSVTSRHLRQEAQKVDLLSLYHCDFRFSPQNTIVFRKFFQWPHVSLALNTIESCMSELSFKFSPAHNPARAVYSLYWRSIDFLCKCLGGESIEAALGLKITCVRYCTRCLKYIPGKMRSFQVNFFLFLRNSKVEENMKNNQYKLNPHARIYWDIPSIERRNIRIKKFFWKNNLFFN